MAFEAEGWIVIGQIALLVLLFLVIYVSIRNGKIIAQAQLDILRSAMLEGDQPDPATMGRLIDAVGGVHKGMASRTRLLLAMGIFSIASLMALALAFGVAETNASREILGNGVTLLFGLLATIVGFYFGGRAAAHAGYQAKEVVGALEQKLPEPDVEVALRRVLRDKPTLKRLLRELDG